MDITLFQELMELIKMDFLRELIERYYERNRNKIFEKTEEDPEIAHEKFVRIARLVTFFGLENLLLNHSHLSLENRNRNVSISNAAGFNKFEYQFG